MRSSIECLIAAVALRTGSPVLVRDRDFHALAPMSDLDILRRLERLCRCTVHLLGSRI